MGTEQPDRFRDVVLESQTLHHVRPGRHCRRIRRILDREPSMLILRPALRHLGGGDGPKLARGFARWRLAGLQVCSKKFFKPQLACHSTKKGWKSSRPDASMLFQVASPIKCSPFQPSAERFPSPQPTLTRPACRSLLQYFSNRFRITSYSWPSVARILAHLLKGEISNVALNFLEGRSVLLGQHGSEEAFPRALKA